MLYVFMSGSTNTGVAPFCEIASIDAIYVFAGTMISSPCPNPYALIIKFSASSPFATPIQCFTPQYLAKFFSKLSHSVPNRYQPESNTRFMLHQFPLYIAHLFDTNPKI